MDGLTAQRNKQSPLYVASFLVRRAEVGGVFFDISQLNGIDLRKLYFKK